MDLTQTVLGHCHQPDRDRPGQRVLDRKPAAGMDAIHTALDAGTDPRLLARQVVDYLRALLLIQMGNAAQVDLAADTRAQAEKHARAFPPADVLRMIKAFNAAATDLRGGWQPSLPLELALAEVMEMPRRHHVHACSRRKTIPTGEKGIRKRSTKPAEPR